jgi:kynureninase
VIDEGHFPSVLYSVGGLREQGLDVEVVPETDAGFFDTPRFLDAIDAQTSAVLACHVQFRTAEIIDVASIAKRAREFDALTIIDGYQAVGTIPIDVESLHVDAYIGGCLKWLCGGPGTAFLWLASARIRELNPTLSGWMAHRRPFAFEPKLDRRDDMWRFLHGTPNVPALFAARPGLELIGAVGLESIRAKSLRQTDCLMALADARGWQTPTPRDHARRGGTVALDVPNGLAVSRALKAREILCDYRTGVGIRLSPHFYTRNDELDDAMCAVADTLKTRDWERFIESRSAVT